MRLIDADALETTYMEGWGEAYSDLTIDLAPTIDAVPVVRCGECKHWVSCEGGMCVRQELFENPNFKPTSYCSYGEKRDEGYAFVGETPFAEMGDDTEVVHFDEVWVEDK